MLLTYSSAATRLHSQAYDKEAETSVYFEAGEAVAVVNPIANRQGFPESAVNDNKPTLKMMQTVPGSHMHIIHPQRCSKKFGLNNQ